MQLRQVLAGRDQRIGELTQAESRLQGNLAEREQVLEEAQQQAQARSEELVQLRQVLAGRDQRIGELTQAESRLQGNLAEREQVIAAQGVKVKGLQDALAESQRNITKMDASLIGLRAELDEKGGSNEALQKRLDLVEGRFAEIEQELRQARQLADERSQFIRAEAEKVSRLEIALAAKETRLQAYEASQSVEANRLMLMNAAIDAGRLDRETFLAHISALQSEVAVRQSVELDLRASIDVLKKDAGELHASRDCLLVEVHDQLAYAQSIEGRARLAFAWTESQSMRTIEALQSQLEQLRAECGTRRSSIVWNTFMRCVRMFSWKWGAK